MVKKNIIMAGEVTGLRGEPIYNVLLNDHIVKLTYEHLYQYYLYLTCAPNDYLSWLRQP